MKILFDTNALIWLAKGDDRIYKVYKILNNEKNNFYISTASFWEIEIKSRLGKIDVDLFDLRNDTLENGFYELLISSKYLEALFSLPMYHKDPFDQMIIAQAQYENMTIITGDSIFKRYLPNTITI